MFKILKSVIISQIYYDIFYLKWDLSFKKRNKKSKQSRYENVFLLSHI